MSSASTEEIVQKLKAGDLRCARRVVQDPDLAEQRSPGGDMLVFLAVQASSEAARLALDDPEIYTLANPQTRWSVAHEAVKQDERAAQRALQDPAIHRIGNQNGYTVLHMAVKQWKSVAREALKSHRMCRLAEQNGQTVAHSIVDGHPDLAEQVLADPAIYRLQANFGDTVAHWAAEARAEAGLKALRDPDIYDLPGEKGRRVAGRACAHKRPARKVFRVDKLRKLQAAGSGQDVVEWALSHYRPAVEALLEFPHLWEEAFEHEETWLGFGLRHHPELLEEVADRPDIAQTPASPKELVAHRAVQASTRAALAVCRVPEIAGLKPPRGGSSAGHDALYKRGVRQSLEERLRELFLAGQGESEEFEGLWKTYLQCGQRWANRFRRDQQEKAPEFFERLSLLSLATEQPDLRKEALRDLGRTPPTR